MVCTLLPAHSEIDAACEICRHIDAYIECMPRLLANPCAGLTDMQAVSHHIAAIGHSCILRATGGSF